MRKKILVTGSNGLVGLSVCAKFFTEGYQVFGIDNDSRAIFFGPEASTKKNLKKFRQYNNFEFHDIDITNHNLLEKIFQENKFDSIVHCAAQPSHDYSARWPIIDFEVNARGTLNILKLANQYSPGACVVNLSSNKVFGNNPNKIRLVERETRFDYDDKKYKNGINEEMSIDHCIHSPFGVSKTCADLYFQEYGNYFGLKTVSLRCGCLTGAYHSAVELHGFLNYLTKCIIQGKEYIIYGYHGKQVRDNLDSKDLAGLIYLITQKPPQPGSVYNVGGGKENSCSIIEAANLVSGLTLKPFIYTYVDNPRKGDHICYYTDLTKIKTDYPEWCIEYNLKQIILEITERYGLHRDKIVDAFLNL